jgi:hypothetical protein
MLLDSGPDKTVPGRERLVRNQTANPQAEDVRLVSNAQVVRGCVFLGNKKSTSGWGGGMSAAGSNEGGRS